MGTVKNTTNVWDSVGNYKKCKKKIYDIAVCKPPTNTVVLNKLEQADAVKALGGRTYFTADEVLSLKDKNPQKFALLQQILQQGKAYVVNVKTPFVLAGTLGELWAISADKLAAKYAFIQDNGTIAINQQTLSQRAKGDLLDWTRVRTLPDNSQAYACFVSKNIKGQIRTLRGAVLNINGAGVNHGKGDFVIAQMLPNGQPNMNDRYVVNGDIFATTYNNQGWTDCINSNISTTSVNIESLPKIVTNTVKSDGGLSKEVFENKVKTIFNKLQAIYKFETVGVVQAELKQGSYDVVPKNGSTDAKLINDSHYEVFMQVSGQFRRTWVNNGVKESTTSGDTYIRFTASANHKDSAIIMALHGHFANGEVPEINGKTCYFPHNTVFASTTSPYRKCASGLTSDINCEEEVKYFKEHIKDAWCFLDNRGAHKNSVDFAQLAESLRGMRYIVSQYLLNEGFNSVFTPDVNNTDSALKVDYRGFAKKLCTFYYLQNNNDVLSNKVKLTSIVKSLLENMISDTDASDWSDELCCCYLIHDILFYQYAYYVGGGKSKNKEFVDKFLETFEFTALLGDSVLGAIGDRYISNTSQNLIDKNLIVVRQSTALFGGVSVSIDLGFKKSGDDYYIGFDVIPYNINKPNEGLFTTHHDSSKWIKLTSANDFITSGYSKMDDLLADKFYRLVKKNTDVSYAIATALRNAFYDTFISLEFTLENNSFHADEQGGYRMKGIIYPNADSDENLNISEDRRESCVLFIRVNGLQFNVSTKYRGLSFNKTYKVSISNTVSVAVSRLYVDLCRGLKIHPARAMYGRVRVWTDNILEHVNKILIRKHGLNNVSVSYVGPIEFNADKSKLRVPFDILINENVRGTRTAIIDFNYKNFNVNSNCSASSKLIYTMLRQNNNDFREIEQLCVSTRIRGMTDSADDVCGFAIDPIHVSNTIADSVVDLINGTKKYSFKDEHVPLGNIE